MTITIRLAAAFVCCALLAGSASAESVQAKLEAFEFFGDWSPHCDEPPSLTNTRRHVFVSGSSRVMFIETLGADYRDNVYVVLAAKRQAEDRIDLRIELNRNTIERLSIVRENGRLRTMTNRRSYGPYLVRDGIALATGKPTPWLSHCTERR